MPSVFVFVIACLYPCYSSTWASLSCWICSHSAVSHGSMRVHRNTITPALPYGSFRSLARDRVPTPKWPVTANACVGYKAAAGGSRTHGPSTYPADCCVQCIVLITFRLEIRIQEDCPCRKCENQGVARLFSHGYYNRANIIYRNLDCRYSYTAMLGKPKRARNKLAKLNGLASTQVNGNSSPTWGVQWWMTMLSRH